VTLEAIGEDEATGVFTSGEYFSILTIGIIENFGVLVDCSESIVFGVLVLVRFGVLAKTFLVVMGVSDLAAIGVLAAFGVLAEAAFGVLADAAFGVLADAAFGVLAFALDFANEVFLVAGSILLTGV
jgi:hypothetical protein